MKDQDAFLIGAMVIGVGAFLLWPGEADAAPAPLPRRLPPAPPRRLLPPPPPPPASRPPGGRQEASAGGGAGASSGAGSSGAAASSGTDTSSGAGTNSGAGTSSAPATAGAAEVPVIEMPPEIIERPTGPEILLGHFETDEVRALGRVIRSEAGTQTVAERVAIAWVARNRARRGKTTIARLTCTPCGKQGKGRPFTTRLPPREEDLRIARQVLAAPASTDPTGGADAAFEPVLQDKLHAAGRPGYSKSAVDVRRGWTRDRIYYGNAGRWELYGPKRAA